MASIRSVQLVLLAYFLFSSYNNNGVEGNRRLISKEDDIEFERQLKLLNMPAVESIQTKYGNIYDCVDFYKQPAFDHPLLKNHTFHPQIRPYSVPKFMRGNKHSQPSNKASDTNSTLSCPFGTVPIRRITKNDLLREKLHLERYGTKYSVLTAENPGTHYAVVKTSVDPNKKYNGGGAFLGIYTPTVTGSQYSSSRMKIQNGPESIQIGWTISHQLPRLNSSDKNRGGTAVVNPILYGDTRTRLYIYLNAGQSRCFNTQCPGFVIVDTKVPLDDVLVPYEIDGVASSIKILVYKDTPVGNWWLEVGETKVGFWPERIFTNLADSATSVEWGGEVFSPPDVPSPQMGSGKEFGRTRQIDAYCNHITTVDETYKIVRAVNTEEYVDTSSKRYQSFDFGYEAKYGHAILFGGPGGATGN